MSKKRILLIGGNFSPEPTGIGKYNGEMMAWLADNGDDCTVITTYPYYPQWKIQEPYAGKSRKYLKEVHKTASSTIKVYRCPHYVPENPSGITRILSDFSFAVSSLFRLFPFLLKKKFDIVIVVVPPFHLGLLAVLYKKFKKTKLFYHIQDMQIEAAQDLGMIKSASLLKMLYSAEQKIFKNTDVVSSISDGMMKKIKVKAGKDIFFFPNWSDTKFFHPLDDRAALKQKLGYNPSEKIVLYSGAIGEKQGLEAILEVAEKVSGLPIRFLISGSGPYKEKLTAIAVQKKLTNVDFVQLQPLDTFNEFLNMADLHLVLQKANASDLVMPSKLTNILAVGGVAVITAEKGTSLYEIVQKNNIGLLAKPEDSIALTNCIKDAVITDQTAIAKNARAYADEFLSMDTIMNKYRALF